MKKLVVYVNKADMVEDAEMLELVRLHNFNAGYKTSKSISTQQILGFTKLLCSEST